MRLLPLLVLLLLVPLAACDEGPELPLGVYAAEHDPTQTVTIHPDHRIAFDQLISGPSRQWQDARRVGGGTLTYAYRVNADGGIWFAVSSNSVAGLDLISYHWAWRDGVIVRTNPETGETAAFFGLE